MSVKRETTRARRRLEFMLRCIVRLLARPGVLEKELNQAVNTMLDRVGPAEEQPDVLAELIRRGGHVVADGYSPQSMADSDIHGGFANATPVENRALRLAAESEEDAERNHRPVLADDWAERERDVAADKLRELVTSIDSAATTIAHADRDRKFLVSIQWRQHNPEDADKPDSCGLCPTVVTKVGADRIKSGYCPACYEAWRRAGAPQDPVERRRFETERLAMLQARDRRPVTCEHICCPVDMRKSVTHVHFHAPADCPSCAAVRDEEAS